MLELTVKNLKTGIINMFKSLNKRWTWRVNKWEISLEKLKLLKRTKLNPTIEKCDIWNEKSTGEA